MHMSVIAVPRWYLHTYVGMSLPPAGLVYRIVPSNNANCNYVCVWELEGSDPDRRLGQIRKGSYYGIAALLIRDLYR